ncbi:uncharacterized protein LACBIDRAFT_329667 [Laccaria bicolor S238N-H82]|uniref:Predicted protein n=1 Tax=Laccaria bicolor (strain S238N-H82 / ATCC MYA-4686) TaxID=486041 RepID=B0DIR8_LACBS|nr:uncharacterized protein LACBIDRAFT_329667 [Laccaria bicolor S238N-H82]EDR05617.1 predicted protein [Laccaria bicolor S238N-H82]|eukprot:XP_001883721.1 predicted protein [Laccaria bicolor S238N-H82]
MTTGAAVNEVNKVGGCNDDGEVGACCFLWAFVVFRVRSSFLVVGACHNSWVGWALVVFRVRSSFLMVGACQNSWVGWALVAFRMCSGWALVCCCGEDGGMGWLGKHTYYLPMTWQRHGRRPSFLARHSAYPYVCMGAIVVRGMGVPFLVSGSDVAWAVSTVGGVDGRRRRRWAVSMVGGVVYSPVDSTGLHWTAEISIIGLQWTPVNSDWTLSPLDWDWTLKSGWQSMDWALYQPIWPGKRVTGIQWSPLESIWITWGMVKTSTNSTKAIFEVRLKDDNRIVDMKEDLLKGNPLVLAYLWQNAPSKLKQDLSAIAKPSIAASSFQTAESSTHVNTPSSASLTALLDNAHIGALQPNSVEERHNVDEPGALANVISGVQPDKSQGRNSTPQSSETLSCSGSEPHNSVDGLDSTPDGLGDTLAAQNIIPSNDQGSSPSRPSSGAQRNRSSQSNNRDNLDIPQRNANCLAATRGRRKRPHQEVEPVENEWDLPMMMIECLQSVMAKNQGLTRQLERGCMDIFSQYNEVQGIHPMDYEQALPSIQAVIPDERCLKRRKIELGLLSGNIAKLECILDGKMLANELKVLVNENGKMTDCLAFSSSDTGDMVSLLVEQNDIQNFFETYLHVTPNGDSLSCLSGGILFQRLRTLHSSTYSSWTPDGLRRTPDGLLLFIQIFSLVATQPNWSPGPPFGLHGLHLITQSTSQTPYGVQKEPEKKNAMTGN